MGHRAALLLILVAALCLRLGWGLTRGSTDEDLNTLGDQIQYVRCARNLISGRGFVMGELHAYRTPGYPVIIAALGSSPRAVRVAQAFIDTATVLAAYLLARRLAGDRAALMTAAIVAANPLLISFSGLILTETLYTATLAWGMWLLVRGGWGIWLGGVVLLAAGGLIRPSGLGLAVVLAGISPLLNRNLWPAYGTWSRIVVGAVVGAVVCLAVMFPWAYRNARHPQLGEWIWTTTNEGISLYDGLNPAADGSSALEKLPPDLIQRLSRMTEVERDHYLHDLAVSWAMQHPGQTIILAGRKVLRTWSPVPLSSGHGRPIYIAVALAYFVPVWLLVIGGLCSRSLPRNVKFLLMAPAIYFTLVHAVSVGSMRYRLPADVPMSIMAAVAAAASLPSRSGRIVGCVKHGQASDKS